MLLIGAGLLIRSFWKLQQVSQGFDSTNVTTMEITLPTTPPSNYTRPEQQAEFFRQALERNNNNRQKAANELGVSRMTLYKRLHRYGLFNSNDKKIDEQ